MAKKPQHHNFYPHHLVRFLELQGGQYGALDLVAITDDVLELQLGGDFVRLTRRQAEALLEGVAKFLALERREHHRRCEHETPEEEEEERERREGMVETVAEEALEHEPRPRPRARPAPPGERETLEEEKKDRDLRGWVVETIAEKVLSKRVRPAPPTEE